MVICFVLLITWCRTDTVMQRINIFTEAHTAKDAFSETASLFRLSPHFPSPAIMYRAEIFKKSMGARNRVGIGLSYRPTRLHKLAESIPGFYKRLKIRAQYIPAIKKKD